MLSPLDDYPRSESATFRVASVGTGLRVLSNRLNGIRVAPSRPELLRVALWRPLCRRECR
ncbi:hypothetical protein BRC68_14720 [Halobacteriales archaeon QH_6_64_20]|nr:MAG: hypothetical protein BRC68_14720 [Halobacteriales archaeon QH_6_64_20]